MRVVRGWCDPLATPRPLGPLIDMLAGLGRRRPPRAAARRSTPVIPRRSIGRLLAVLAAGIAWVWVIEDAHWADGATLDLLRFLARRIDALPVLLVVSYRDDEIGPTAPVGCGVGRCGDLRGGDPDRAGAAQRRRGGGAGRRQRGQRRPVVSAHRR